MKYLKKLSQRTFQNQKKKRRHVFSDSVITTTAPTKYSNMQKDIILTQLADIIMKFQNLKNTQKYVKLRYSSCDSALASLYKVLVSQALQITGEKNLKVIQEKIYRSLQKNRCRLTIDFISAILATKNYIIPTKPLFKRENKMKPFFTHASLRKCVCQSYQLERIKRYLEKSLDYEVVPLMNGLIQSEWVMQTCGLVGRNGNQKHALLLFISSDFVPLSLYYLATTGEQLFLP